MSFFRLIAIADQRLMIFIRLLQIHYILDMWKANKVNQANPTGLIEIVKSKRDADALVKMLRNKFSEWNIISKFRSTFSII